MRRSWRLRDGPFTEFRIIDLPQRHEASYFVCLEDYSSEMADAGDHKAKWYEAMREQGLRVKLAVDYRDHALGMIQYVPIERSPADGNDLYMILCIWVHGYDRGVGNVQGKGLGSALLEAAEKDVRELGADGMVAWGLHLPVWMKSSWFVDHGYERVDREGLRDLVWKPFRDEAMPPSWIEHQPLPKGQADTVDIVAFKSGWCPASNLVYERARKVAEEVGTPVAFTTIDTSDRETQLRYAQSDAVFVEGRPLQRSAPPSMKVIRKKIERQLRRQRRFGARISS